MTIEAIVALTLLIFVAATLYSSVGHAGASGYLAAMALVGVAPGIMRPMALTLNILVAVIATIKFYRVGCFSWSLFWPFAIASVPFAFLGGLLSLPSAAYKPLVSLALLYSAYRLLWREKPTTTTAVTSPPRPFAFISGAGIGLLSGLTGVGGGIFLSPLLLFMSWAETRQSAGVSAAFILVNSVAGLAGVAANIAGIPRTLPLLAAAAVIGGFIGAEYGSRRLANIMLQRLLAVVLVIAAGKLLFT